MNAPWMLRAPILPVIWLALASIAQANEPPTVKITQPSGGAVSAWWAGVYITAKTTGTVEQVAFSINGEEQHVDTEAPYHFIWKPSPPGLHDLVATATLPNGEVLVTTKKIRVIGGGHLVINEPVQGDHYGATTAIPINVTATDPDGIIARVEIFAGGEKIGEVVDLVIDPPQGTPLQHEFVWQSPPEGLYELHARAIDESGSAVRSFSVWVYAGIPRPDPRISVSLPDGTTYNRNESIPMVIEAVNPVGPVDFVDLLANGEFITSVGGDILDAGPRPPGQTHRYVVTWPGFESAGPYEIEARYQNPDGTYIYSAPTTLTIADRERDDQHALTIVEPSQRVFAIGDNVELKFHAVSPTGFIPEANIFLNGDDIGLAAYCSPLEDCDGQTTPFIELFERWSRDLSPGVYNIQARATVDGIEVESAPITFTIFDPSQTATITISQPLDEAQYIAPVLPEFRVTTFAPGAFLSQVEILANGEPIGVLTDCPLNAICATPIPGTHRELRHFFPSTHSGGLPSGRYTMVARGSLPGSDAVFESDPVEIYVRNSAPSSARLSFLAPEYDGLYQVGEPIPLHFYSYLPDARLQFAEVYANGNRIGHASDCPPNAFCGPVEDQQINTLLSFYQDRGPIDEWGTWTGAPIGRHTLEVRSNDHGQTLSETRHVIVTNVTAMDEPQFVLPVPDSQFVLGELVPIELIMIMPDTEHYGSLAVAVGDEVIGYLSHCPPNADCGWPDPGSLVRLKFYPSDLRNPWESWSPRTPGRHTLKLAKEDSDTGVLTFGDTVTIEVGCESSFLKIRSGASLQLLPIGLANNHTVEASTNLTDWRPLALPANTTAISLDPKASPTQFFRLVKP